MPASKARVVYKVERGEQRPEVNVQLRNHDGSRVTESLDTIGHPDITIVCANVGINHRDYSSNEAKRDAVASKVWSDGYEPRDFVPMPKPRRNPDPHPVTPAGDVQPSPAGGGEAGEPAQPGGEAGEAGAGGGDQGDGQGDQGDGTGENDQGDSEIMVVTLDAGSPATHSPGEVVAAGIQQLGGIEAGVNADQVAEVARETVAAAIADLDNVRPKVTVILRDETPRDLDDEHYHQCFPEVLSILAAGAKHVYLTGPAGTGKSTIAEQCADVLKLGEREPFYPMSVGPADQPSKLFGFIDGNGNYHSTPLREAFEHGGVFLLDELDNGSAGCTTALNQALANGLCSFPDGVIHKHADFRCFATTNTFGTGPTREYVGRNKLDAATLNRFPIKVEVDYDRELDKVVAQAFVRADGDQARVDGWLRYCWRVRELVNEQHIHLIVSPRDVGAGASLLTAGFTPERVLAVGLFAGVSDDVRAKCDPGITGYVK